MAWLIEANVLSSEFTSPFSQSYSSWSILIAIFFFVINGLTTISQENALKCLYDWVILGIDKG